MWSDSEDLAVVADMYQIKIKIITFNGPTDKHPIEHWIFPDETLKEHARIKDVDIGVLVLLH